MVLINIFKALFTFLKAALLINLRKIDNVSSEIFLGLLGIKAGPGSKYSNYFATRNIDDIKHIVKE